MAVLRTSRIAAGALYAAARQPTAELPPGATPRDLTKLAYVVPAGKRAIVRHVTASINVVDLLGDANMQVYVNFGAGNGFYIVKQRFENVQSINWAGQCVLDVGDQLFVYVSGTAEALFYQITGAILDLPQ
jgi:hypothetical protein